jgi:GntR family transcriptional regulator
MGGAGVIQLNYRDSKPIYEQIKDGLRKLIISNSLSANEKLPSVRELAAGLAINPNTIQRAYRELESEGFIYSVPGKGSFVAEQTGGAEHDLRRQELFEQFDGIVEELYYLAVSGDTLKQRIDADIAQTVRVAEGGDQHD